MFAKYFQHVDKTKGPPPLPLRKPNVPVKRDIRNVGNVLLVSSGKGGVGKSTVSSMCHLSCLNVANIAVGLSMLGMKVALLDCDIYGPSIPRFLNLEKERAHANDDGYDNALSNHIDC